MARRCAAACLLLLAAALPFAHAKCYQNGYKPKPVPEEEQFHNHEAAPLLDPSFLPKGWNWCDVGGVDMCTASWAQHIPIYCGSCWAHGTLSMIQDRLKIKKQGLGREVMLARQTLLNCGAFDGYGAGCDGGDPIDVFRYMKKHGLPDESCMLYNATDHTKWPNAKTCPVEAVCNNCMPVKHHDTCWAVKTPIKYFLESYGKVDAGEAAMMSEIFYRGPIVCSIATPEKMIYDYRGGIMTDDWNTTKKDIDHNVELVGWGEEDGKKFWHVRNSWGTFWGELGFFRLERGTNALWVEGNDCWYAEPEYQMEQEVRKGELVGTMYGVVEAKHHGKELTAKLHKSKKHHGAAKGHKASSAEHAHNLKEVELGKHRKMGHNKPLHREDQTFLGGVTLTLA